MEFLLWGPYRGVGIFLRTKSELGRATPAGLPRSRKLRLRGVKGFVQGQVASKWESQG